MSRILFAWELGGNLGHVMRMRTVARALRERGHDVSLYKEPTPRSSAPDLPREPASYPEILLHYGFADPTAANDPIYVTTKLACQGQIRFGPSGRAAAAAVWLVAPCAELFQDQRPDDGVDLAIGTEFNELTHNSDIDAVLTSLRPEATQAADPTLLQKIHTAAC